MNKILALPFLLISLTTFSQLRPTGGGVLDEHPSVVTPGSLGGGGFDEDFLRENKSPEIRFKVLDLQISQNDQVCHGNYLTDSKNILDTYYTLVLYKSSLSSDVQCAQNKTYLKCLNDSTVKLIIAAIKQDKKTSIAYLKKTYQIDRKTAKQVIDFFSNLSN